VRRAQVGGRLLKYSAQAARVSGWIAGKLQGAIGKNLTFPSCADIPLPPLLAADAPAAGLALPAFLAALQDGAARRCRVRVRGFKVALQRATERWVTVVVETAALGVAA